MRKEEEKSAQQSARRAEEEQSARRAVQKREMIGPVNVTLNDPAVVIVGTILGPNLGEEKQTIYYDDGLNK